MKKILFISAANSIHTVKWVNGLTKFYEVHLAYCPNHESGENEINASVKLHPLKYSAPLGYYLNGFSLKKIYQQVKPDLVNVHYASGYGTLVRNSKVKCDLLSIWGSDIYEFPQKSKFHYYTLKKNLEYANNIASTSSVMAEKCKSIYPNLRKEFYIIPFGIDIRKFKHQKRQEKNENTIKIGIVKTLEPSYGIEYLVEAMKYLKEKNLNYKIEIYGDGSCKEKIQNLIADYNLQGDVVLKGRIKNDEVPQILNTFDIFCATSIFESFGVSVVEAMATGIPVIVSDAEGFLEVTNQGETGIIFEKKNSEQLAQKIEELAHNRKKREELSILGRKRVEEYYDFEKNLIQMQQIYEKIMEK